MSVLLIGTLDTKGVEFQFVRDLLRSAVDVRVLDAGVLHPPVFPPDISREEVYAAAGVRYEAIRKAGDRGQAIAAAAKGAAKIAVELHTQGKLEGVLGLGGSAGTTIATHAMRALPFGVPKLMVSTLASGQVQPFVGVRDITMMHSVVDICGLNRLSRTVLTNAAHAMIGMVGGRRSEVGGQRSEVGGQRSEVGGQRSEVGGQSSEVRGQRSEVEGDKPMIAATMFGVTTPCVERARKHLEESDFEVLVFHATGSGGLAMESLVRDGLIAGVLDLTTTELADELVGGILTAGRDRLTAAGLRGVPQVISVGALDMVNFGPPETVPEKFRPRRFYQHNPNVTLMRTTPEENDELGKEIAHKASAARGPTAVLIPRKGVSALDAEGQPFWQPEADAALFQSVRDWIGPQVRLIELDLHINDREFAETAARTLREMMAK